LTAKICSSYGVFCGGKNSIKLIVGELYHTTSFLSRNNHTYRIINTLPKKLYFLRWSCLIFFFRYFKNCLSETNAL
jgi:hypothetical protein